MEKKPPSANTIAALGASLFSSPSPVPKSADKPGTYTFVPRPDLRSAHAQQVALLSDALAVLCVPRPGAENKHAVCLWVKASGVEVYIAGGKGSKVGDDVVQHVRGIFECLGDISRRAYEARVRAGCVHAKEIDERKLRAAIVEPLSVLMSEVYAFAGEKFLARLENGWAAFDGFAKEVRASVPLLVRRGMSMCLGKMIRGMPGIAHFQALEDVHRILGLCRAVVLKGDEMLDCMEWAYHLASTLGDEYRLDGGESTWVPADDIAFLLDQSNPYPLRRFLHKATILTRAVDILVTFAIGPRNRPFFALPLHITPLNPLPTKTNLTSSTTPWSTLLTTLLTAHSPPQPHNGFPTKFSKSAISTLTSSLEKHHPHSKKSIVTAPIPAEIRLATHMYPLLKLKAQSVSRVYIGLPTAPSTPSTIFLSTLSSLRIKPARTSIRFAHRPRSRTGKWPVAQSWILPDPDTDTNTNILDVGLPGLKGRRVQLALLEKVGERMGKAVVREMWRRGVMRGLVKVDLRLDRRIEREGRKRGERKDREGSTKRGVVGVVGIGVGMGIGIGG